MTQLRLEVDDVVAAQELHMRPAAGWRYLETAADAVLVVGAVLSFAFGDLPQAATCLGLVAFGLVVHFVNRRVVRWKAQRLYHHERTLRDPSDLHWNERGLTYSSSATGGTTAWADYRKWKENERVYLLYQSRRAFQIVPKRFFGAPADEQGFRRHLSRIGVAQPA